MYMSIRRERSHKCGHSNIDYRTKNDSEAIKTFMPWKVKKEYGTMGNDLFKLPFNENKKILKVTENINTQKNLLHEIPDPKYYKSAQFYQTNNIPIKAKTIFVSDRVAQLDESFKGKEKYNGDSMMISDLTKNRRLQKEYEDKVKQKIMNSIDITTDDLVNEKNMKKERDDAKRELIINDKKSKNKSAFHETQLQNIDATETLNNQVDIKKINEIRLALRRRYVPRRNYRRIFKQWDKANMGEISIVDAHNMINKLSIPINIDETRSLISSSNKRGTETLNLQEFMHLIFNDNDELNLKIKNISKDEERFESESEKLEFFRKRMENKISESAHKDNEKYLLEYLRLVIPKMAKKFNLNSEDKLHCDYKTFRTILSNFQIPQKYIEDHILTNIFDTFQQKDQKNLSAEGKMNYRNFIDYVIDNQETSDFFDYKKKYVNTIENKLSNMGLKIQEKSDALQHESQSKKAFAENLRKEIEEKKIFKNENNYLDDKITNRTTLVSKFEKDVNSVQPSLASIHKSFKDKEIYFQKKIEAENSLSANPIFFNKEKPKTRFGANPPHKDTFYIIAPPKEASSYVDEKKRFDIRCKWDVDFQVQEKLKKAEVESKIIQRKRKINEAIDNRIQAIENYQEQKDNLSQMVRTHKIYKYENKNKMRSEMIE